MTGLLFSAIIGINIGNTPKRSKIMKRVKQILAILGIVVLVGLYILTLVFAITDNSSTQSLLAASIFATIVVPVLLWAYSFIYRMVTHKDDTPSDDDVTKE